MKAERFRQIRNLFDAVMERSADSRNEFLREACQGDEDLMVEVGKLLAAQGQPTAWIDESLLGSAGKRLEGRRIGHYQILRQLGEGGMGAVYLASNECEADRHLVALKIVRPEAASSEVLRRFRREREILEALDHPNIARVFDGGMTDEGLPYLVMAYIDGKPIDVHCEERQLDITARLKLFRDVCAAVHYAHQHHVVHRDLKPANVLVTSTGVVKLLDFGIARLATTGPNSPTCLTHSDLLLMTPEYASPEQVMGGVANPSSDVYTLGVLLYELLTGRRPYRFRSRILKEIVRVICEEAPERPSTAVMEKGDTGTSPLAVDLNLRLKGNLDCILLKALAKDPNRRYRSAQLLGEDIRCHIEGLSVAARKQAGPEAVQRFLTRNAWWVALLGVLTWAMVSGVVNLPQSVLVAAGATALVFVGGYYVGTYERGEDYARRSLLTLAKGIPFILIVIVILVRGLPSVPFSAVWGFVVVMILTSWTYCGYQAIQWKGRDRLGPLMLEMDVTLQRRVTIFAAALVLAGVGVGVVEAWRTHNLGKLLPVGALLGMYGPLLIMFLVTRPQIRQGGVIQATGLSFPWARVTSYSWEQGAGKLEGKYDVLHLTCRRLKRHEFHIPVGERPAIHELLEQQLQEWPG